MYMYGRKLGPCLRISGNDKFARIPIHTLTVEFVWKCISGNYLSQNCKSAEYYWASVGINRTMHFANGLTRDYSYYVPGIGNYVP